jgi:glycosyltransferase involved in cell wall biosynthesis
VPEPTEPAGRAGPVESGARVVFVVPPGRPPSGGDLYNRFLQRALAAAGFAFETTTLERLAPETYQDGAEFWVDSLYIPVLGERDPFGPGDRLFFIVHSLPSTEPGMRRSKADELRAVEDGLFDGASGFLVTGAATREVLAARGFGGVPALVVPPAPCVLPKGPSVVPDVFDGLIVSSLIHGKGVPEFLDPLGREVRASDRFRLRIAGRTDIEPGTAAACLESVQAHPLLRDAVRHLGFVPYEDLGTEYGRSSALISPSSSETYGMAFHEARAFGLPILAVRAPYSAPFIETGRTGLLCESAAELAEGMLELVREPRRARDLAAGAAAARPSSSYTWDDAAESFLKQHRALR